MAKTQKKTQPKKTQAKAKKQIKKTTKVDKKVKTVKAEPKKVVPKKVAAKKVTAKRPTRSGAKENVEVKPKEKKQQAKRETKRDPRPANSVPQRFAFYSEEQYAKYKQLKEELQDKPVSFIQEALQKNDQSKTGSKDEILNKLIDGMILGKIPRCSKCFGGRPRFNQSNGNYVCPGYRDDLDFRNCRKVYVYEELKRETWVE